MDSLLNIRINNAEYDRWLPDVWLLAVLYHLIFFLRFFFDRDSIGSFRYVRYRINCLFNCWKSCSAFVEMSCFFTGVTLALLSCLALIFHYKLCQRYCVLPLLLEILLFNVLAIVLHFYRSKVLNLILFDWIFIIGILSWYSVCRSLFLILKFIFQIPFIIVQVI